MKFPDLLNPDTGIILNEFDTLLKNNQHLEKELSSLLNNYGFKNPSIKTYLISICYTLVDWNLALAKPFKENFDKNISDLISKNSIDKTDVKAIDQCLEKIISLSWK